MHCYRPQGKSKKFSLACIFHMVEGRVSLVPGSFLVSGIQLVYPTLHPNPNPNPHPNHREGYCRGPYASYWNAFCWKSVNMRSIPNKLEKFKDSSALPELYYYCSILIFETYVLVISLCFQRFILTEHHSKTQSEFPDLLDKCRIECTSCRL